MAPEPLGDFQAIIVAGGRGERLGGVVKPLIEVGGHTMLDAALAAAESAEHLVVVGDLPVPPGVMVTQEQPAYGGPAAGVVAGLDALPGRQFTLLLASDLPQVGDAVPLLLEREFPAEVDGVCADLDGRPQWLLGLYRTCSLRSAAEHVGSGHGVSLKRMLGRLDLLRVDVPEGSAEDVDTPQGLEAARARADLRDQSKEQAR